MSPAYKRRIKLIKPRLQLRLVAMFAAVSVTSLLLQYLLFSSRFSELASRLPDGGAYVLSVLPGILIEVLVTSFAFLLPVMLCVGVLSTFRIAGPIYRFEQYLRQVVKGEAQGPCRIRDGDELWDLCDLINQATAPVRLRHGEDEPEEAQQGDTSAGEQAEPVEPDLAELRLEETPPALSRRRAS